MPFLSKIGGGSARRFGLTKSAFKCLVNGGIVTLGPDNKCYYPANYPATATNFTYSCQVLGCHSGGGYWGSEPEAGCCSCAACPYENCVGCFSIYCQCYTPNWQPLGTTSGSCYAPYYATSTCTGTSYSCPVNTGVATVSGTTCVYPATYNATLV